MLRQVEAEEAEEAEAEKAALLAETLKRARALQEQIQKITASVGGDTSSGGGSGGGYRGSVGQRPMAPQEAGGAQRQISSAGIIALSPEQPSRGGPQRERPWSAGASPSLAGQRADGRVKSTPRAMGDGKKRRARQPMEMLEHGDLACTTEWWQPGSKGGPDARLDDILGRAALASGDPKGTLEKLIVNSKISLLKDELDGLGGRDLEQCDSRTFFPTFSSRF